MTQQMHLAFAHQMPQYTAPTQKSMHLQEEFLKTQMGVAKEKKETDIAYKWWSCQDHCW